MSAVKREKTRRVAAGPKLTGNEWVVVRNSAIHGTGLFARKAIPAGTRILEYVGEMIDKEESERRGLEQMELGPERGEGMVYIFEVNDTHDLDGNVPENIARFANHSCEENTEAVNEDDQIFYYTTRELPKGGEVLIDYGYGIDHYQDHPCRCGAPSCVGYIVNKAERPKLLKRLAALKRKKKKAQVK